MDSFPVTFLVALRLKKKDDKNKLRKRSECSQKHLVSKSYTNLINWISGRSGSMSLKCTQPPTPLPIYLSPAPSRGLAIRGDSVQAGAIRPESLRGDHSAESVRFEY